MTFDEKCIKICSAKTDEELNQAVESLTDSQKNMLIKALYKLVTQNNPSALQNVVKIDF